MKSKTKRRIKKYIQALFAFLLMFGSFTTVNALDLSKSGNDDTFFKNAKIASITVIPGKIMPNNMEFSQTGGNFALGSAQNPNDTTVVSYTKTVPVGADIDVAGSWTMLYKNAAILSDGTYADVKVTTTNVHIHSWNGSTNKAVPAKGLVLQSTMGFRNAPVDANGSINAYTANSRDVQIQIVKNGSVVAGTLLYGMKDLDRPDNARDKASYDGKYTEGVILKSGVADKIYAPSNSTLNFLNNNTGIWATEDDPDQTFKSGFASAFNSDFKFEWRGAGINMGTGFFNSGFAFWIKAQSRVVGKEFNNVGGYVTTTDSGNTYKTADTTGTLHLDIPRGKSVTYTMTPNEGYELYGVTMDGKAVTPTKSGNNYTYTFNNNLASHTLVVEWTPKQKADVVYTDTTANTELEKQGTFEGWMDEPIGHDTAERIKHYEDRGYELVNDEANGAKFDRDPTVDQLLKVNLKHKTTDYDKSNYVPGQPMNEDPEIKVPEGLELEKTVNRVIHYRYLTEDGEEASADVVQTAHFTRTVTIDNVTGEVVEYGEWTSTDNVLDSIESPYINAYEPSKATVEGTTLPAGEDVEVFVIYNKSAQLAKLTILDGETPLFDTAWTGEGDTPLNYDPTDKVKEFTDKGYELINDNYEYDGKFDMDDETDQEYTIVLNPIIEPITPDTAKSNTDIMNPDGTTYPEGLQEKDLRKTITRTIHYRYLTQDGEEASADVVETVTFTRTATVNHVTGEVIYTDWTPDKEGYSAVESPYINGYVADKSTVEAKEVTLEDVDSEEYVIYQLAPQKATVVFVDENGNELEIFPKDGLSLEEIDTSDIPGEIEKYLDGDWELVSNEVEEPVFYDADDNVDQVFKVVLKQHKYTVTFVDGFGETLKVQPDILLHGKAEAPGNPVKEGYKFLGWDVTFDDITGDLTVTAKWEKLNTVTFVDGFGNTLKVQKDIPMHGKADAPEAKYPGYVFKGWDVAFDDVTGDLTVTALWEPIPKKTRIIQPKAVVNTGAGAPIIAFVTLLGACGVGLYLFKKIKK